MMAKSVKLLSTWMYDVGKRSKVHNALTSSNMAILLVVQKNIFEICSPM